MNYLQYDLQNEVKNPDKLFFEDEVREGFYVWTMMKRFWAAQLQVLSEIDIVCKRHNLRWYADNGTLLGAVRHRGYIPWDDDLDICMFRDDYIEFMKYAPNELPDGYVVKDVQLLDDFDNMIGRVNNTSMIHFETEHMEKNFGCPYIVGVDIFPLDGLYRDEDKEDERRARAINIFGALVLVGNGETDTDLFRGLMDDIEVKNNIVFDRNGDIKRQLILLADKVISECPVSEADDVAFMSYWVEHHNHNFSKEWYKNTVFLPFEYIHMQAPAQYDSLLAAEYGNYMGVYKDGGIHEYPLYLKQEDNLRDCIGENVLRYTMPKERHIREEIASIPDRLASITDMLRQAHMQLQRLEESGEYSVLSQLAEGCCTLINSVVSIIYDRGDIHEIQCAITEYKTLISDVLTKGSNSNYTATDSNISIQSILDDHLNNLCTKMDLLLENRKNEILFLPVKADWWHTMESAWKTAIEDENNDVYVMPLLYLEKDFIKDEGEEKNDIAFISEYVSCISIEEYDIAKRHPDKVYIQDPYDGFNTMIAIPEYFYSSNLPKYTDELIYIPCYDVDDPESDDDKIIAALRLMIEQPAVYNADRIMIKTEKIREVYVDYLVFLTGEELRGYWEDKVVVAETEIEPNSGRLHANHRVDNLSEEWRVLVNSNKRILLYQINASFIMQNGNAAINKIRDSIRIIKDSKEDLICVFSPHETIDQVTDNMLGPELNNELHMLLEEIKRDEDIFYDENHAANSCWYIADAYYGTKGYLPHMCSTNRIPTMIMNII